MKIGIVSDSHDHRRPLQQAVRDAKARGAQAILHAGDIVASSTLAALNTFDLPIHVIHGNNMGDTVTMSHLANRPGSRIHYHGQDAGITLGNRKIFLVHYPHYARAMATTGEWDLVVHGHDHRPNLEWITNITGGKTLLADPGSVAGLDGAAHYIIGDLSDMAFQLLPLPAAHQRG